jgi:L-ascorbate metabolism protein UlaG (beta-lactamase superfamily)
VYFAGDTDVFGDMALIRELYAPELVVLPIGDAYTMGPRAAALAVKLLQPKAVIPCHYGTFPVLTGTPAELAALVDCQVLTLTPGEPIIW